MTTTMTKIKKKRKWPKHDSRLDEHEETDDVDDNLTVDDDVPRILLGQFGNVRATAHLRKMQLRRAVNAGRPAKISVFGPAAEPLTAVLGRRREPYDALGFVAHGLLRDGCSADYSDEQKNKNERDLRAGPAFRSGADRPASK